MNRVMTCVEVINFFSGTVTVIIKMPAHHQIAMKNNFFQG